MKWKNIAVTVLISAATAFGSFWVYNHYIGSNQAGPYQNGSRVLPVNYVRYSSQVSGVSNNQPGDFVQAASIAIPTAVHIKTTIAPKQVSSDGGLFGNDPLGDFFGGPRRYIEPGEMASGSGVIISDNGYIVTNNHVIDGASDITVTLNNRETYKAKLVGRDPNTDLAVIKIDAHNLPYLIYGNSDNVKVGQWVLAVGYPLDLETTVTAGIVSAKSRQIHINHEGVNPVESYIQTDAAVNPGNSGGPLVNTSGQLVGINSAIASPTGSFAGYAYAIPVNIVKKVVNDILKYGTVQRAFLGVTLPRYSEGRLASFSGNSSQNQPSYGVLISGVDPSGGAAMAGLKGGDIITKIDGEAVNSQPQLMEKISTYRPGDRVNVTYLRGGAEHTVIITLRNRDGNTGLVEHTVLDKLGADFQTLSRSDASKLGITGGVAVGNIGEGLIRDQTNLSPGFVITSVNNHPVNNLDELQKAVQDAGSHIQFEGIYPNQDGIFYYGLQQGQ